MYPLTFPPERLVILAFPVLLGVLILSVLILGSGCSGIDREDPAAARDRASTVILLSLDGVRWDYLDKYDAPHLEALAAEGVRAERLTPVFPTKTFPTHYSIVTGLYAENHGIISNTIFDPDIDDRFSLSNREAIVDGRWWEGEPLWVTAEKQGQTAATYFWPGSEAPIQHVRPTYWREYDGRIPGEDRVDHVLAWLDLPVGERPTFITLYFSETDGAGHRHGPDSPEVAAALLEVDGYVGRLIDGLRTRGILGEVNVVVTSDHGMTATSEERVIILDDFFEPDAAHIVDFGPALMMYPPDGVDKDSLVQALDLHPRVSAYEKSKIPERYHIAGHHRTPPILAVADDGWSFSTRERFLDEPSRYNGGAHGYDNALESMGGLFIASGPAFRRGVTTEPLLSVHIYEMVCVILGLDPVPNDGSLESVADVLIPELADVRL